MGLHAEDGVHLNDLGQLAMGVAILKGLRAPLYMVPGNHDVHSNDVDRWRQRMGKDYDTFVRTPKSSALWYADAIRGGTI